MGFDDGSAQVRNIREKGQPTAHEHQEHMTTHRPYRSWCKFCVMGRHCRGRSHKLAKREARPSRRDHQWSNGIIDRDSWLVRPEH